MSIEPLEPRIAPASLTFTDVDGDVVVVTTSGAGTLTLGSNVIVTDGQLQTLDLTSPAFQGASVKIVAKRDRVLGGDGLVNVGYINATGRDLAAVRIDGDLGAIDAGDPASPASACKGLTALSLGRLGTSTGASDLTSDFDGKLDKLRIKSDVNGARIMVSDSTGANGKIGSISIGGSLIGGVASQSGFIFAEDALEAVTIGGDLFGGAGDNSGELRTAGTLGPVKIGGSVRGDGAFSGLIDASAITSVTIGGSLVGGAGRDSGEIYASVSIGQVTIGGNVKGGAGTNSGAIRSDGAMGAVKIGHNVQGGSGVKSGSIESETSLAGVSIGGSLIGDSGIDSGQIHNEGDIGAVKIGRHVQGGTGLNSGSIQSGTKIAGVSIGGSLIGSSGIDSGQIQSEGDIGPVKIGHHAQGGTGLNSGFIDSGGKLFGVNIGDSLADASILSHHAMGIVKVGGDMSGLARIYSVGDLAGVTIGGSIAGEGPRATFTSDSREIRSDSAIGPVHIGGNLAGDASLLGAGHIFAKGPIASITIGGSLIGGAGRGAGEIRSESAIGPIKIGGDIVGGYISNFFTTVGGSGYIEGQRIASLFVGGSIRAGVDNVSGSKPTDQTGSVRAIDDIGPITIKGHLLGSRDTDGDPSDGDFTPVVISARGQAVATAKTDVAIKSITVGGRVEFAQIVAGFDTALNAVNSDAQVGAVRIGGDWIASRIAVGSNPGADGVPGTNDDFVPDSGNPAIISRISSILIKGQSLGTTGGTDSFGIVAQKIGSFKIGSTSFPLSSESDFKFIGSTGDTFFADWK